MPKQTPQPAYNKRFQHCIKEMRRDFKQIIKMGVGTSETSQMILLIDQILKTKKITPQACAILLLHVTNSLADQQIIRSMSSCVPIEGASERMQEFISETQYIKDFLERSFEVIHIKL